MQHLIVHYLYTLTMNQSAEKSKDVHRSLWYKIPFTWYFVLFLACAWLSFGGLYTYAHLQDARARPVVYLLLLIVTIVVGIFILLSVVNALVCWWALRRQVRNGQLQLRIEPDRHTVGLLHLSIAPVWRPALGYIRFRLLVNEHYSEKFSLSSARMSRKSAGLKGTFLWQNNEEKEYVIQACCVYVEDYFRFFSFPVTVAQHSRFFISPEWRQVEVEHVFPSQADEASSEMMKKKKSDGEYLQYKHFESSDDVRRIVWKIYARNRELVVRTPEKEWMEASEIRMHVSFFSEKEYGNVPLFNVRMLNFYKNVIWSAYHRLKEEGFRVAYTANDWTALPVEGDAVVEKKIGNASWVFTKPMTQFGQMQHVSLWLISSLVAVDDVERLLDNIAEDATILFVPLSEAVQGKFNWLQWIFREEQPDSDASYQRMWRMSIWKNRILENEKQIHALLENRNRQILQD